MRWNRRLLLAKLKALCAHLGISVVLVGIAVGLILLRWFPAPLFTTDGGGIGLKLLLLVDLVLGPLLTFVVFNPLKARRLMVLDLAVIAVLQLSAYGAGLWSIYTVRVQAVALSEGVFHAVTAKEYQGQNIEAESWQALGSRSPYLVNVRAPKDSEEAGGVTAFAFTAGLEPYQLQFLYEPLQAAWPAAREQGWTINELKTAQPGLAGKAATWLAHHPALDPGAMRFYRVEGFYGSAVLALDAAGQSLGGFDGELGKKP